MGVFDNLGGTAGRLADTLGRDPESTKGKAFNRDFNAGNFDTFSTQTQPGKWVELASFKVPASTEYSFGYGRASNPENQGYLYVDLFGDDGSGNTTNEITGTLRLKQESATGRQSRVIADFDLARLDQSKSDRNQQVPLPEQVDAPVVTQDSFLVLEVKANESGEDVTADVSDVIVPVTEYDLSA